MVKEEVKVTETRVGAPGCRAVWRWGVVVA